MGNIVGIDIGTTHCKVAAVNKKGQVIYTAKKSCNSFTDETGMHEQDAEAIFGLLAALLAETFTKISPATIVCVSFSTAMHSLLAVDEGGKPLMRAMTWADTRAGKYAKQLKESPDSKEIFAQTGVPVHAMTPYCKLVWLKQEKPEIFGQAHKFISIKEYIFFRLFGRYVIDEAMASGTGLFNLQTGQWSEAALKQAEITTERLSEIVAVYDKQTALLPAVKQQLGLQADITFIAGCSDGGAAQLGSGALLGNEVCVTIGTSGAVRTFVHAPITDEQQRIFTYILTKDWYFTGGPTNNGGIIMQWFAQLFLPGVKPEESFEKIITMAKASEEGAKGLLFVPYLHGERAPVWDASATGQFAGLKSTHTLNDFARAVVEGVLLNIFDIFQSLPNKDSADTIYANGGFFNNPFMSQLLADITGKKVLLQKDTDSSVMGAVYLGMLAVGWLKDLTEVKKFIATDETFLPDAQRHEVYKRVFERYAGLKK